MAVLSISTSGDAPNARISVLITGGTPGALVDIERQIVRWRRADARAKGVPESEVNASWRVATDHPLPLGAGTWHDYRVRSGIEYAYRVREGSHDWVEESDWR